MKKISLIFIAIFSVLLTLSLTSCKAKKLDYQICGLYLEVKETKEYKIGDGNPTIYFKYNQNNIFSTNSTGQAIFQGTAKKVEIGEKEDYFYFTGTLFVSSSIENVKVHLIILENGNYKILSDVEKTINGAGSYKYASTYVFNKKQQIVEFNIMIKERG